MDASRRKWEVHASGWSKQRSDLDAVQGRSARRSSSLMAICCAVAVEGRCRIMLVCGLEGWIGDWSGRGICLVRRRRTYRSVASVFLMITMESALMPCSERSSTSARLSWVRLRTRSKQDGRPKRVVLRRRFQCWVDRWSAVFWSVVGRSGRGRRQKARGVHEARGTRRGTHTRAHTRHTRSYAVVWKPGLMT